VILGSDIHGKIRQAVARQKTAEAALSDRLYDCEKRIARLVAEREEAFTQLAQRYLPELNAESVKTTLREVQSEVGKIYLERQARRQALEREMVDAAARRSERDARLTELEGRRSAKAQDVARLKEAVLEELRGRPDYSELRRSLSAAGEERRRVESLGTSFTAMAGAKARDYEANRVFSYLSGRGYGTPAYRANPLTRALDAWTAGKIDYVRQKTAYDLLRHGARLLGDEAAQRGGRVHEIELQTKALEREVAGRHGLVAALDEAKALDEQRSSLLEEISRASQDWDRKVQERADLDSTKGSHHVQALERLKTFLKGQEIAALKARASAQDTPLTERIATIDDEIRILKKDSRTVQQEQAALARRLRELHEVESHFTRRNYDTYGARFSNGLNIDAFLLGCIAGHYSARDVCSELDRHRYVEPPPSFSSSSDSFSSFSSSSSSSSFGSSSSSSSSSDGGGGFSSGGGF
jgi:hypothetical protein